MIQIRALAGLAVFFRDLAPQQRAGVLLYEYFFLKVQPIQFHEFVGVPRVAIFASKLAAAVGIDGPFKWHALGIAAVQNRAHRQEEILWPLLGAAFGLSRRRNRCEAGNANQWRSGSGGSARSGGS